MRASRFVVASLGAMTASLCLAGVAAAADSVVLVHPTGGDFAAAKTITNQYIHAKPAAHVNVSAVRDRLVVKSAATASAGAASSFPTGSRFPTDLTYHGGAVVTSMVSHPVFLGGKTVEQAATNEASTSSAGPTSSHAMTQRRLQK